jgi:hypothetical protein
MQNGLVIGHVDRILLQDVQFKVREGGRQRVLREKRKNVHAFVVGTVVDSAFGADKDDKDLPAKITYNPYKAGTFMWGQHPVKAARVAMINERGVTAAYLE